MPNWCDNYLVLKHDDPQAIRDFCDAYNGGQTMQAFLPCPEELRQESRVGFPGWYDWCIEHWGTKWDFGKRDYMKAIEPEADGTVRLSFDTAWSPPIEFYDHLVELGYDVEAYYCEIGVGFCGTFDNDAREQTHDIPPSKEEFVGSAQADILNVLGIHDLYEETV